MERTTSSMILRAKQAYVSLLCEKQTLELGICYFSTAFATLPEVNQYREVIAVTTEHAEAAVNEAISWFDQQGLTCQAVAPANGHASSELQQCLEARGFVKRESKAMALTRWGSSTKPKTMRVLPARAVRQAYQTAVVGALTRRHKEARDQAVAVAIERLDSPQLDAFVVMEAGQPLGHSGLFQVGDMALITDLCVVPGVDAISVQNALLAHILTLARRLELRNIFYELPSGIGDELKTSLDSWGFVIDGVIEEFQLATPELASPLLATPGPGDE